MAVFSKLIHSLKTYRHSVDPSSSCACGSDEGLRIRAKLLLPLVPLPDPQPAMLLFNNGEKRKGKPKVTLTLSAECIQVASQRNGVTENGDAILEFPYALVKSVDVNGSDYEVAITFEKPDGYYWCVCLKVKGIKTKGRLAKSRKITGKQIKELIQRNSLKAVSSQDFCGQPEAQPEQASYVSTESLHSQPELMSESTKQMDSPETQINPSHLQNESPRQSGYIVGQESSVSEDQFSSKRHYSNCSIISHSVSCPILPTTNSQQCRSSKETPTDSDPSVPMYAYSWDLITGHFHFTSTDRHSDKTMETESSLSFTRPTSLSEIVSSTSSNVRPTVVCGADYVAYFLSYLYRFYMYQDSNTITGELPTVYQGHENEELHSNHSPSHPVSQRNSPLPESNREDYNSPLYTSSLSLMDMDHSPSTAFPSVVDTQPCLTPYSI